MTILTKKTGWEAKRKKPSERENRERECLGKTTCLGNGCEAHFPRPQSTIRPRCNLAKETDWRLNWDRQDSQNKS